MDMNLGILEKINSSHSNLRTTTMKGIFEDTPEVGEIFVIQGEGLAFGNRMIYTTPVKEIVEVGIDSERQEYVVFKTHNSTYKVSFIDKMSEEEANKYIAERCKIPEATTGVQ